MMKFVTFKTIDVGSVAGGAAFEKTWISDDDYIIHRIFIVEKTGATLYNVVATILIDNIPISKEDVPLSVFGSDVLNGIILDLEFKKSQAFKIAGKNNTTTTYNFFVVLELHKES